MKTLLNVVLCVLLVAVLVGGGLMVYDLTPVTAEERELAVVGVLKSKPGFTYSERVIVDWDGETVYALCHPVLCRKLRPGDRVVIQRRVSRLREAEMGLWVKED